MLGVHGETTLARFPLLGLMLLIVAALHASSHWARVLVIFVNVGLDLVGRPAFLRIESTLLDRLELLTTALLPARLLQRDVSLFVWS